MKEWNRKDLLVQMEALLIEYCDGCFLHGHFKKENGKRFAHRFCITQCTVGEQLREYGKKLANDPLNKKADYK